MTEVDTRPAAVAFNEYEQFIRSYAKDYLTPFDVETMILDGVTKENTKVDRPLVTTPSEDKLYDSLDELNYDITRALMSGLSNAITNNTGTWGCNPYSLQAALIKYCSDNGFNTDTDFCLACSVDSQKSLEKQIFKSISDDIPVIMLIGFNLSDEPKTEYRYDWDATPTKSVDSHYVVITGIYIDNVVKKSTLTVSTWSRKAYIELDNFLENPGSFGGIIFIQT